MLLLRNGHHIIVHAAATVMYSTLSVLNETEPTAVMRASSRLLDLSDLRGVAFLNSASGRRFAVVLMLGHWKPFIEKFWTEQIIKCASKLATHCAVQNEVDGRVYQCHHIHEVPCEERGKMIYYSCLIQ